MKTLTITQILGIALTALVLLPMWVNIAAAFAFTWLFLVPGLLLFGKIVVWLGIAEKAPETDLARAAKNCPPIWVTLLGREKQWDEKRKPR